MTQDARVPEAAPPAPGAPGIATTPPRRRWFRYAGQTVLLVWAAF
ncbi:MAG: hypothetical protein SFY69_00150 [Planctomycetota bacterium]|nr:hypothetical protein [Planctomycetota bacterium]